MNASAQTTRAWTRSWRAVAAALVALLAVSIVGCSQKPYEVSKKDRDRFGAGMIAVEFSNAPPLIEGIDDCIVWKAQYSGDRIAGWKAALGADWGGTYPKFLTGCMAESLAYRNGEVRVYICARAIGAGGGCNNGGYYRSRTGERPWLRSWNQKEWVKLSQ